MDRKKAQEWHCSVEATIAVLGGKYKAIIVWHLNHDGVMRYSELQKAIPQATAIPLFCRSGSMMRDFRPIRRRPFPPKDGSDAICPSWTMLSMPQIIPPAASHA